MAESGQSPIDLEKTLRLMDVADEVRRQHRRVQQHLEASDRERIKHHLMRRYKVMGHDADPELLKEAIDLVLAQQYRFKPPRPGLGLTLAKWYARRGELARTLGWPLLGLIALAAMAGAGLTALGYVRHGNQERAAEAAVAQLYRQERNLRARLEQLAVRPLRESLTEADDDHLEKTLSLATSRLDNARTFLARYAPAGKAGTFVRRENYREVRAKATNLTAELEQAERSLSEARDLLERKSALAQLVSEADTLFQHIRDVGSEEDALAQARRYLADAKRHLDTENVAGLREAVAALSELARVLDQEYDLLIVRGIERDNARFYLIVQAIGPDKQPVKLKLRNEETGRLADVTEWGERVPKSIYDRVAQDYEADHTIDENRFGVKHRGYLRPDRQYENLGQITEY
jgi:hypothetical protein